MSQGRRQWHYSNITLCSKFDINEQWEVTPGQWGQNYNLMMKSLTFGKGHHVYKLQPRIECRHSSNIKYLPSKLDKACAYARGKYDYLACMSIIVAIFHQHENCQISCLSDVTIIGEKLASESLILVVRFCQPCLLILPTALQALCLLLILCTIAGVTTTGGHKQTQVNKQRYTSCCTFCCYCSSQFDMQCLGYVLQRALVFVPNFKETWQYIMHMITNLASIDHVIHPLSLCLVVALLQLLNVITYMYMYVQKIAKLYNHIWRCKHYYPCNEGRPFKFGYSVIAPQAVSISTDVTDGGSSTIRGEPEQAPNT